MRNELINILLECGVEEKSVLCRDFITNNILDSLIMAEIVISIEDNFNIEINGEDITPDHFKNIDTIVEMVRHYDVSDDADC